MLRIPVKLKDNSYNINVGFNCIKSIPSYISSANLGNFGVIITTKTINSLYRKLIKSTFKSNKHKIIVVPDGEISKSRLWLFRVIEEIAKIDNIDKKLYIVCLGGGVVGDLGGFCASIYKRGIPYIQIPTTFLSQIDSSIGGKTAIDIPEAKNILGAIYQPKAVFIDPNFLSTLPQKEFNQGLAEVIKYGVIKDKVFFNFLKNNHKKITERRPQAILKIISVCASIKAKIVSIDEKEKKGIRTILNFGHTFAHALESSFEYKRIAHGDAVSLGMVFASILSVNLKKCNRKRLHEIINILKLYSLPVKINFNSLTLYKSICYDKKFISGKIRMVLLEDIGKVIVCDGINQRAIKSAINCFKSHL